jgi:hypothetical protein
VILEIRPPWANEQFWSLKDCYSIILSAAASSISGMVKKFLDASAPAHSGRLDDRRPANNLTLNKGGERRSPRLALSGISSARSTSCLRTFWSSNALSRASLSLSRIAFGVPLGANKATHENTWNSGSPASFEVGTFGRTRLRCSESIVYALIAPLCTCGMDAITPPSHM